MHVDTSHPQPAAPLPFVRDPLTLALFVGCFALWTMALVMAQGWPWLSFAGLVVALILHASLSHELLHGGVFRAASVGTAVSLVQPGLTIPYLRFKRTHLAHHQDANLTDPYDDPESNYFDPVVWARLPRWQRLLLRANNTLLGRMVIGPALGQWSFMRADMRLIAQGDARVAQDWAVHVVGLVPVVWAVWVSPMSGWVYLGAVYCATGVLKIRTFAEHCAHARASARTAIVEDRGLLGFLFLNNNLHVVHHMHPSVAWYRLPGLYRAQRARYCARNGGYVFASYGALFRQYLLRAKDPVPHPIWDSTNRRTPL